MAVEAIPRVFEMENDEADVAPASSSLTSQTVDEADSVFKIKAALIYFGAAIVVAALLLILKI